jgi:hypothetical protein
MSDTLGPITIPDPPVIGAFPLQGDYGSGFDQTPPTAAHVFEQPGLRTEQRFLLGPGVRRFRVVRSRGLACNEYDNLKAHWLQAQGGYAQFPYTHWGPGGSEAVTARYENPSIQFDHLVAMLTNDPGVTLLEVPTVVPAYTSTTTVNRFPDSALTTALLSEVQEFVPLVQIIPRTPPGGAAPAALYLASRRCTVNGQLYLPRLFDWNGITQTISEASDAASFTFGNADDVFTQLANQVNLFRATIILSFFHVQTNYLIQFWQGNAKSWNLTSDGRFVLPASDATFELGIPYPWRTVSRTCWKVYKGRFCPSVSANATCDKSQAACVANGVPKSFGGLIATPQNPAYVRIADMNTGVFGYGTSSLTSLTIANETIYQRPVQEVYTDEDMLVTCDVAGGRDESEFYSALGVVSEGPISSYSPNLLLHKLDDQPPHDPLHGGGWRGILGTDPASDSDFFALDQAPWGVVPSGATYAAGIAFAEIRRTDEKGLQLSAVSDRKMQVTVTGGIAGWTWTAPGARVWTAPVSNAVWVAINVYLRGLGLRVQPSNAGSIPAAVMESYFDVNQAIAMAAICDTQVAKLVGTGNERQFPFRGVLKEQKPLKDWLTEILNSCLGYYTFVNGKLWIGIRYHSGVPAGYAFSQNNILMNSLQATPLAPQFNWLDGQFGDEEFNWDLNTVSIYDLDAAGLAGTSDSPLYTRNTMSFVGISNKSQCARVITTRLREELGGVGVTEQLNARNLQFKTTIMAMQIQVGDVISLTHPRMPGGGPAEGRVQKWTLNPDFSIDITASPTTDSMYDLDVGPKPVDVPAAPVIPETLPSPTGLAWMPNLVAPFAGDPLYTDASERTFDIWQDYTITKDGNWSPAIWVAGEQVVNHFLAPVQPTIVGITLTSGGTLNGPQVVYAAVVQRAATSTGGMGYSVPSNLAAIYIPAGATGQQVNLALTPAPSGSWTDWELYCGNDRRRIARQGTATSGALPGSLSIPGPIHHMTQGLPEGSARRIRIAAKLVHHSGVAGVSVTSVTAPNQIVCTDFVGSTDNWINRIVSALADASDGSAPLWNFQVTGFNSSTGTFTVTPNCVVAGDPGNSVEAGDVLIVRSTATAAGTDYIEDSLWNNFVAENQFGSPGLTPGQEQGRLYRILRGTGAGQVRQITGNTAIRISIQPPWDTVPDATSIGIVEAPEYPDATVTSDFDVSSPGNTFQRLVVDNLGDRVILVTGYLIDDQGLITDEEFAVSRELYIFGEPPGVRDIGPAATDPNTGVAWAMDETDQTLRADTSANDIPVQLLPLALYHGRALFIVNNNGPHSVVVTTAAGETLFDGTTSITVLPMQTVRLTAG